MKLQLAEAQYVLIQCLEHTKEPQNLFDVHHVKFDLTVFLNCFQKLCYLKDLFN